MLLNGSDRGFIRMLNYEVAEREALDAGRSMRFFCCGRRRASVRSVRRLASAMGFPQLLLRESPVHD
jgi:hypothetical protein